MASLNKVQIIGYLGRDPELRHTQSGAAVASFSMATKDTFTKDNEKKEKTEWHRIVFWGKLAEVCGKYLSKGSLVYIEGRLQTREWEDKDGGKKYVTEVIGYSMQMLGGKSGGGGGGESKRGTDFEDGDIPF